MPTKAHHRARSSIDQVIDLLADLEEQQIALLLDDFNHTTPSNVPVNEAIALFETQATNPKRKSNRPSSPMKTLQAELERRHSKRISSAPEPRRLLSMKAKSQTFPTTTAKQPSDRLDRSDHPDRPDRLDRSDRSDRPSLILSPPAISGRPRSSSGPSSDRPPRSRSYKRISRPMLLSPTATAELHHLLLAFFSEAPVSSTTTATPSPTTPHMSTFLSPFSPFSPFDAEPEPDSPGLDLLEPSPTRTPHFDFASASISGRSLRTTPSMSSIFEVMRSQ